MEVVVEGISKGPSRWLSICCSLICLFNHWITEHTDSKGDNHIDSMGNNAIDFGEITAQTSRGNNQA